MQCNASAGAQGAAVMKKDVKLGWAVGAFFREIVVTRDGQTKKGCGQAVRMYSGSVAWTRAHTQNFGLLSGEVAGKGGGKIQRRLSISSWL